MRYISSGHMLLLAISVLILCGCGGKGKGIDNPKPSVYYWRTTYKLSNGEKNFIKQHGIKKMYMRFFDVVVSERNGIVPNATVDFLQKPIRGVEIIPVVFINEDCLRGDINGIADKLVRRVKRICETNGVRLPHELQIDCDYTARSRDKYYDFLQTMRKYMGIGVRLSVTIRLHQLSMPAPEGVDYGVLMMYNTGDLRQYGCHNPILDFDDVKPFLKHLDDYGLPLCAAYPNYQWQLLFHGKTFKAILHGENLGDPTVYAPVRDNVYSVVSGRTLPSYIGSDGGDVSIAVGDSVFVHYCSADDIIKVKRKLGHKRRTINSQVIIYSLDQKNINRYKYSDYEEILSR